MARIMCVDDDKDCLGLLKGFLTLGQHDFLPMLRADKIVDAVRELKPELVITDLMMPGVTGGAVYHMIRKEFGPFIPIIVSSGSSLRLKLPEDPLLDYCPKPVDIEKLLVLIDRMLFDAEEARKAAGV